MPDDSTFRTKEDLERAVRALAREFKTDTVFVIGSQAILLLWPDAPEVMRGSPEIDAYPENAKLWEIEEARKVDGMPLEASEHIHGLSVRALHFTIRTDSISTALTRGRRGFRKVGIPARLFGGSALTGEL